jgi:hypothetical protein
MGCEGRVGCRIMPFGHILSAAPNNWVPGAADDLVVHTNDILVPCSRLPVRAWGCGESGAVQPRLGGRGRTGAR